MMGVSNTDIFIEKNDRCIAVSSSPRPWIDVFDLPEKINMAVTGSDLDLNVRKMSITF